MSAGRPPSHIQTINSGLLLELPTPRKETPAPGRSTEQREADHEDQNHALTQPDGGNSQLICPPNTKLEEKFMRTQTRQSQRSSISSTHSSTSSSSSEDPYYELILSIHELLRSFQTHLIDLFDTFGPEAFPLVVRIARVFDNLIQKSRETDDFAALSRIKDKALIILIITRSRCRLPQSLESLNTNTTAITNQASARGQVSASTESTSLAQVRAQAQAKAGRWDAALNATLRAHYIDLTTSHPYLPDPRFATLCTVVTQILDSSIPITYGDMNRLRRQRQQGIGSSSGEQGSGEVETEVLPTDRMLNAGLQEILRLAAKGMLVGLEQTVEWRLWGLRELSRWVNWKRARACLGEEIG